MSTDTLEFPTLDLSAAPNAVPTEVALATSKPLDLTKISLTSVALAMYGPWRKKVDDAKANLSTLALDLSTAAKCAEARSLRKRLVLDPLAEARKTSASIKSTMAQTSKDVGAELAKIEAAWEKEVDPLILPQIIKREEEIAEEKRKRDEAEKVRKEGHQTRIEAIRIYIDRASAPGMTAERVARGIAQLEAIPTPTSEQWEEFAVPAADVLCQTLDKMRALHAKLLADEQAEAERARIAAAQAEEAKALAELKAKIDRENAELEQRAAAFRAEQEAARKAAESAPAEQSNGAGSANPEGPAVEASAVSAPPITQDAQERGLSAGTPAACASTEAKAATASASGCEGQGAHADERAPEPDTRPDLNVGAINERLGFTLTRAFIETTLGVDCDRTEKGASYWRASKWPTICDALVTRIADLRGL